MAKGKSWTREELYLAMNLYCKIPFGSLHHTNLLIEAAAQKLGRTPSSVSMKLCNFASFDPRLKARGIRGLTAASRLDKEIWDEFNRNWNEAGTRSEEIFRKLLGQELDWQNGIKIGRQIPKGRPILKSPPTVTEKESSIKVRIGQDFFRATVLSSYGSRCCISGNPVPELLIASHILPWSAHPEERLNPRNGLCLSCLHDAAFDRGLIGFDEERRLILSKYLEDYLSEKSIEQNFHAYQGQRMRFPEKFLPDQRFLQTHRKDIFRA